ncbi:branched-chain amino acid aminotransferase [Anseongella ginsenosidimutans]|uniref:branched-chain-amino-acid transaminase n=1 Tax=Anseongella ginsenosidimutans TaxID=496056 RepID=A0A4R3KNJ0_9SPHI|nr:aminotransferase class IV [Anseongella ginsenosidimutans]QEC53665.1 4-amino-4-deoxychorismate lyase [Anseongella ginsenosidimutans]TCS86085.1 branched-chain amino acid aminotransferase [Anseongella ginsenosidimutans]
MSSATFINYNGKIVNASEPLFTSGNRAFRYGDGLFETLRMIRGELPLLEMHARRLQAGMKILKFDNYQAMDAGQMESQISLLSKSNKIFSNARIRFSVYRDAGGLYTPVHNGFAFVVEMQRLEEQNYELNKKGLLIDIFPDIRTEFNLLSPFKTINSLPYVLSGVFKKEHKLDESVLLSAGGHISETTASNIFLIKNKTLFTPELSTGCIDGIMRRVVLKLAAEGGLQVQETLLPPDSLKAADEIFLTNTVRGIQWVVGYKEKRYFNRVSKSLNEALNEYMVRMWASSKL